MNTIYSYHIEGLPLRTGDLVCTRDGDDRDLKGKFWRLIGKIIPSEVDHIAIYIGPGGRCVEAGAKARVVEFEMVDGRWDVSAMEHQRGPMVDIFHGAAYPLKNRGLSGETETRIRLSVAKCCLDAARRGALYNLNYFDSSSDQAFYCSQLAYKAYLGSGINLNTGLGLKELPGSEHIVFPQEIWASCDHAIAGGRKSRQGK